MALSALHIPVVFGYLLSETPFWARLPALRVLHLLQLVCGVGDLDSISYIHLHQALGLLLVLQRQRNSHFGSGCSFLFIRTVVAVEGSQCLSWPSS